jgi:hypothetical protein
VTEPEWEFHLPPGYRLDRSDPEVWALRRPQGWVVAYFSAQGVSREAIEEVAWEDHEDNGEEEYCEEDIRLSALLQELLV